MDIRGMWLALALCLLASCGAWGQTHVEMAEQVSDERPGTAPPLRNGATDEEMLAYIQKYMFDDNGKVPERPWFEPLKPVPTGVPVYTYSILTGASDMAQLFVDGLEEYEAAQTASLRKELYTQLANLQESARAASAVIEALHRLAEPGLESQCPNATDPRPNPLHRACMATVVKTMAPPYLPLSWVHGTRPEELDDTRVAVLLLARHWMHKWSKLGNAFAPSGDIDFWELSQTLTDLTDVYCHRYPSVADKDSETTPDSHVVLRWYVPMVRHTIDVILGRAAADALRERQDPNQGPDLDLDLATGGAVVVQLRGQYDEDGNLVFRNADGTALTVDHQSVSKPATPQSKIVDSKVTANTVPVTFAVQRTVSAQVQLLLPRPLCTVVGNMSIGEPNYLAIHVDVVCSSDGMLDGERGAHSPIMQLSVYMDSDKYVQGKDPTQPAVAHLPCEVLSTSDGNQLHCGRLWPLAVNTTQVSLDQVFAHNTGVLTFHAKAPHADPDDTTPSAWLNPRIVAYLTWDGATNGTDIDATIRGFEVGETPSVELTDATAPQHTEL